MVNGHGNRHECDCGLMREKFGGMGRLFGGKDTSLAGKR